MTLKRTYCTRPAVFDDSEESFARMIEGQGLGVPGGRVEQLAADVDAQRTERAELDAELGRDVAMRETFGWGQAERAIRN